MSCLFLIGYIKVQQKFALSRMSDLSISNSEFLNSKFDFEFHVTTLFRIQSTGNTIRMQQTVHGFLRIPSEIHLHLKMTHV